MWRKIIYAGLLIALVSSYMVVGGCRQEKEIVQPKLGPLESPFSEIIPSAEDIFFESYSHNEETIYHPDGLITYSRIYGNKSASWHSLSGTEKPESPAVVFSLAIRAYQDEEQAKNRIQEEGKRKWYDKNASESYAKLLGLPWEDVVASVRFWKEPDVKEVQGEEEVFFRVGRYVGDYAVHVDNPPELEDGYFMPLDLHNRLESAVWKTNIPKLRSP